jgi:hypothetical protein
MKYWKSFDMVRWIRLAIGLFILAQGIMAGDGLIMIMGGLFSAMPLLNIGCCSSGACDIPQRRRIRDTDDVSYEEVRP